MVSETTFLQTSTGAAAAMGHRVMWSGQGNFGAGMTQSSTEMATARGITKIGWISDRLQLSAPIQEAARRMYQLAVQMNFNVGRATRFVACACLYIVCRRNKSPHLLIDFADVLQTPVKTLGKIYTGLLKRLVGGDPSHQAALCDMVAVPMIDPSVFVERFARRLDLGGMQGKVQGTAMRIIQFMQRDWICVGRRPNGLCGAALLIAAFYHGFQVPAKTIADTVRMREGTLKLRLVEMRQTPMAIMSREQFEQANPEQEALEDERRSLPPCMLKNQRMEARAALMDRESEVEKAAALTDEARAALMDKGGLPALKDGLVSRRAKRLPPVPPMLNLPIADGSEASASSSSKAPGPASVAAAASSAGEKKETSGAASKFTTLEPSDEGIEDIAKDIMHVLLPEKGGAGPLDLPALTNEGGPIDALISGKPEFAGGGGASGSQPGTPKSCAAASSTGGGNEESLSDVDDDELEAYLLDIEEQQHKSDIWHEVNKDYLEEWHIRGQEVRRKRRNQEQSQHDAHSERGGSQATTGSGSRKSRRLYPPASSCTQSAMMALSRKGKVGPNRINIEALESLFS